MTTDFMFRMGKSHEICQDYASEGFLLNGDPFITLSDGCSSAKHTDWGSRLLCQMAPRWVEGDSFRGTDKIWRLLGVLENLGLPEEALAATLLVAKRDSEKFRVWVHGDGSVAGITCNGEIHIRTIQFQWSEAQGGSLPAYLSYHLHPESREFYIHECSNGLRNIIDENGIIEERQGIDAPDIFDFPLEKYHTVLLFSDGVESVQDSFGKRIPSNQVIRELSTISSFKGCFIRRSASFHLKKWRGRDWVHHDDLTIAGITDL